MEKIDAERIIGSPIFKKLLEPENIKTPFVDFLDAGGLSQASGDLNLLKIFLDVSKDDNQKTCEQVHGEIFRALQDFCGKNI